MMELETEDSVFTCTMTRCSYRVVDYIVSDKKTRSIRDCAVENRIENNG
jgi:hypothetical protein